MEVFLCVRDVSWVPSKAVAFAIDPSTWKKLHQLNGNVIVVQQHHQQQQDKVVLEGWEASMWKKIVNIFSTKICSSCEEQEAPLPLAVYVQVDKNKTNDRKKATDKL